MRITLPNLKHSFIFQVPVPVPVPVPVLDFQIFHTPVTKQAKRVNVQVHVNSVASKVQNNVDALQESVRVCFHYTLFDYVYKKKISSFYGYTDPAISLDDILKFASDCIQILSNAPR